jgi:hypothetical protein
MGCILSAIGSICITGPVRQSTVHPWTALITFHSCNSDSTQHPSALTLPFITGTHPIIGTTCFGRLQEGHQEVIVIILVISAHGREWCHSFGFATAGVIAVDNYRGTVCKVHYVSWRNQQDPYFLMSYAYLDWCSLPTGTACCSYTGTGSPRRRRTPLLGRCSPGCHYSTFI